MPWVCNCGTEVDHDDAPCPSCAMTKSSWTMYQDRTRSLVISDKRFVLLRGTGADPVAPKHASYAPKAVTVETQRARVLDKAAANALAKKKLLPAPEDVLFVRLFPRGTKELGVTLTPMFETEEQKALPPFEPHDPKLVDNAVDVRFLFVHGPPDVPLESKFEGVHVVDVSEQGADGAWTFAPAVEVAALKKPARSLPIGVPEPAFFYSF